VAKKRIKVPISYMHFEICPPLAGPCILNTKNFSLAKIKVWAYGHPVITLEVA